MSLSRSLCFLADRPAWENAALRERGAGAPFAAQLGTELALHEERHFDAGATAADATFKVWATFSNMRFALTGIVTGPFAAVLDPPNEG